MYIVRTLKILCTRWYFLKWNLVCMVTKHRKVSIQKLVGIYILTTILKKKVSSRELLFGPTSMSTCRRCIVVYLVAWHAAKAIKAGMAFREGRSPLLDIYRGGPFMASKSQGTKKSKNRTIKKHLCTISRKNNISY